MGGDQTVGRTVCGLPSGELDFTLLPARFAKNSSPIWPDLVSNFESYPKDFQNIIPFIVAAVIHQADWITDNLPTSHPIFISRFWRSGAQQSLKSDILEPCRMTCVETGMVATGIPPLHVFMNMQDSKNSAILSAIEKRNTPVVPRTEIGKLIS
jgi:hypothetical protein